MTNSVSLSGDAPFALYTYYYYIKAWVIRSESIYGSGQVGIDNLLSKMKTMPSVNRLKPDTKSSTELRGHYLRGKCTLVSMESLPINDHSELALSANMWLPVQSYYAIHGVGSALLTALEQTTKTHSAFRACFSTLLHSFFPDPFCACCNGGPDRSSYTYTAIRTSPAGVAGQSNIANPQFGEVDHFLGKSLATTRDRLIEELLGKERRRRRRRRLSNREKQLLCQGLPATTICDFIYRMRIRSNYENPDMYLSASSSLEDAASHYYDLLYLTQLITSGIDLLLEKKLGIKEMMGLTKVIASLQSR
jgi:hypothetical protein